MLRWLSFIALLLSSTGFCCNLNNTEPVVANIPSLLDQQTPRQVLFRTNIQLQLPQTDGVLKMHSALDNTLLDHISTWPTLTGKISSIHAQPIVVDLNYDGFADAVYIVDVIGQLWFVKLTAQGFAEPVLIADFSQTQAIFNQPLQLVQITTPNNNGIMRRQTMLLLIASAAQGDILLAVKHSPQQLTPWQLTDLNDRTVITSDEQQFGIDELEWLHIQQGGGWFINFNQRITAVPQVYAGVVYLTSVATGAVNPDCSIANNANVQLHAVHLHHAGLIYANRSWQLNTNTIGKLALQKNQQGELELSLQNDENNQTLLTELLAINAECADCVDELSPAQFPRLIRLATFETEQGAH